MALDVNGFAVLRSISSHSNLFPDLARDVSKVARTLVIKQIKAKNTNLVLIRQIERALGSDTFSLVIDGVPDAQVKTLVSKLDKFHPDLKTATAQWRRKHLQALVSGSVEPCTKPSPPPKRQQVKKAAADKPKSPKFIHFDSAGAKRER